MSRKILIAILLTVSSGCSTVSTTTSTIDGSVCPKSTSQVSYECYDVTGRTKAELAASIKANGPTEGGKRVWAVAKWDIAYRSSWTQNSEGLCKVIRVTAPPRCTITFPAWNRPTNATYPQSSWNSMTAILKQHEENHCVYGRKLAKEFQQQAIHISVPCDQINGVVKSKFESLSKKWRDESDRYDIRTNFGSKEGLRL